MVAKYVGSLTNEIRTDRRLQLYGIALCLVHLLTAIFWRYTLAQRLADPFPICWPFFSNCEILHGWPIYIGKTALFAYAVTSVIAGLCFWRSRVANAWLLLLLLTLVKYIFLLTDYRFMGNYHYMPFLVTLVYLFFPSKAWACAVLTTLFYLAAGFLKFNTEWLSGASVGDAPSFIPRPLFELSCAYVVLLETVFVWLLWSKRAWLRVLGMGQLVLFHAVSWYWVGFFYPCVMTCLLSIFPIYWLWPKTSDQLAPNNPFWPKGLRTLNSSTISALVIFIACQIPTHINSSDSALDGNLRLLGLNMFDARTICMVSLNLHYSQDGVSKTVEYIPNLHTAIRTHCDPIVFEAEAHNICRDQQGIEEFQDLDLLLTAKRTTDEGFYSLRNIHNFCAQSQLISASRGQGK